MFQAVDCVLEPPLSYNLFLVYGADGIVICQAGFVGPAGPGLPAVRDAGDFLFVRPGAVLFNVIAAGIQARTSLPGSTEASEGTTVWLWSSLS